jgi:hypothetical protein
LDESAIRGLLRQAPAETSVNVTNSPLIVSFPDAEGLLKEFRIVDAPVMAPELAARYPGIHSYLGVGVTDPRTSIRFDLSPLGLHATLMRPGESTVYIDRLSSDYYRVARRSDVTARSDRFECLTEPTIVPPVTGEFPTNITDGKLRTYRLAMISGGEFSLHFIPGPLPTRNDSIAVVLAAQNSHVTRANAVWERDMAIRLVLVPNNDLIIYLNPATDPISNPNSPSGTAMQAAIDGAIGSANYDIGHTQSKGNDNGNAGCIGCVCTAGFKGRAWTVYSNPSLLEFFVIDYLIHEMGHQFGANHTFSFNLEGTGVNVEPGSGVTIMGYAGIVAGQNVALHSIDIFSVKSIEQVSNYILSGNGSTCDVETVTGNNPPLANAGPDYTIPTATPFKLVGTASDPDPGNNLTYNWEQIDNRSGAFPSIPSSIATDGPLFRTYLDYNQPERTFPALQYILSGANGFTWEVLPGVARSMNFRFIVKDNHPGGGATRSDNVLLNVAGSAGPFSVSNPNSAQSLVAGIPQQVTWTVNNTNLPPVNCSNVRILLSTDGGLTFPTVLVANTPNDGSETITLPCIASTTARIKVESIGNIFFDISDADFSIQSGFDFNTPATVVSGCPVPASMSATLGTLTACGFATPINLSASGVPTGATVSYSANPVTPGSSVTVTLNGTNTLAPGTYNITITGSAGSAPVRFRDLSFTVSAPVNPSVSVNPLSQTLCVGSNVSFSVAATNAATYQWQLSTGGGAFANIGGATASTYSISGITSLLNGNQYRVVVTSACATSVTSNPATLTVVSPVSITTQPVNRELCSGSNTTFAVTATSTETIFFQWQISTNGGASWTDVPGATSATLSLNAVTTGQSGHQYRCRFNNISCSTPAFSNSAVLTVRQLPSVTLAAPLTSLLPGQTTTLTAAPSGPAGGTQTLSWFLNGAPLTQSGPTRTVNVEQVGVYRVRIAETFPGGLTCSTESADVTIVAPESDKLFIFPSPNNGKFTVSYYNASGATSQRRIVIVDSEGKKVYDRIFPVSGAYTLLNIDLRTASRGIHIVQVGDATGTRLASGKVHIR